MIISGQMEQGNVLFKLTRWTRFRATIPRRFPSLTSRRGRRFKEHFESFRQPLSAKGTAIQYWWNCFASPSPLFLYSFSSTIQLSASRQRRTQRQAARLQGSWIRRWMHYIYAANHSTHNLWSHSRNERQGGRIRVTSGERERHASWQVMRGGRGCVVESSKRIVEGINVPHAIYRTLNYPPAARRRQLLRRRERRERKRQCKRDRVTPVSAACVQWKNVMANSRMQCKCTVLFVQRCQLQGTKTRDTGAGESRNKWAITTKGRKVGRYKDNRREGKKRKDAFEQRREERGGSRRLEGRERGWINSIGTFHLQQLTSSQKKSMPTAARIPTGQRKNI